MKKLISWFAIWFENLFAIRETRVSTLIILLGVFSGFALWQFVHTGNISENIKNIIVYGMFLVGGVNVTGEVVEAVKQYINRE